MSSTFIAHYDSPHQFEPLLPSPAKQGELLERAADVIAASSALGTALSLGPQEDLRTLLRKMNSFYTNLIEGEHTRPSEIDRALASEFSGDQEIARKQRLAIGHMAVEAEFETMLDEHARDPSQQDPVLYADETLCALHEKLFRDLPDEDRRLKDGSLMVPGRMRARQVAVGIHEAPLHSAVPAFLARWREVYAGARRGEATLLAISASHHRLAWIHPFEDGNGRVSRLHTHLALYSGGYTKGLWSPLRGFARTQDRYRSLLKAADEHRRGDLDGRGNLSEAGLVDWMNYVLDVFLDQARFMSAQLNVSGMRDRIHACLQFEETAVKRGVRTEALAPLYLLFVTQTEMPRGDFKQMCGLGDRQATQLISDMLREGYLRSRSAHGPLSFAIPARALRFYFPSLWPEAEQDEALIANTSGQWRTKGGGWGGGGWGEGSMAPMTGSGRGSR